jgi:putative ABC transport system permease protein
MTIFARVRSWMLAIVHRSRLEQDVDDEIRSHLRHVEADLVREGRTTADARRLAAVQFGSIAARKEEIRAALGLRLLDECRTDLAYAWRTMGRSPGFTAIAILTLGLGIGANTAMFSVANAVLFRPLPYPDPDRLLMLVNTGPQAPAPYAGVAPTQFGLWREDDIFQDAAAFHFHMVNVDGDRDPVQAVVGSISVNFFHLFGAQVAKGRAFTADEDRPHGSHVAVLADDFWRAHFGGDTAIVGRTISLDGDQYTVVGVLAPFDTAAIQTPDGPTAAQRRPDVWRPLQLDPASQNQGMFLRAAARLSPHVTMATARAHLQQITRVFRQAFPKVPLGPDDRMDVLPMRDLVIYDLRSPLWLLMGAVGLVLLITCANVANLLLVRSTVRRREFAVRTALGAGRARLARQLLTESVILGLSGGIVGLVVGVIGIRVLLIFNPVYLPRLDVRGASINLDARVLMFTMALSVTTGLIFGILPAWSRARSDPGMTLRESSGRAGGGSLLQRLRSALVVVEIALALVLVIGAALLLRTITAMQAVPPGFDTHHVVTLRMSPKGARFAHASAIGNLMQLGAERLDTLPDVETATAACCVPLQDGFGLPFIVEGRKLDGSFHGGSGFVPIAPAYFKTFRIPIVRGRAFTDRDASGAPGVVIINEAMAAQYWPTSDPLADRLTIGRGVEPGMEMVGRQIVGIVGNVHDMGLNRNPRPIVYIPWVQVPDPLSALLLDLTPLAWIVRTRGEPSATIASMQRELQIVSGGLPVGQPRMLEDVVARSTARTRFGTILSTTFAVSALFLAAIGIYGVMAYAVAQRTHEIGIRLALGAASDTVRNMVIRQGMSIALVGVSIGIVGAFGVARLLATFLFGVTARDPVVFMSMPLLLGAVAFLGVWLPARRASRVDPVVALRTDQ